MHAPARSVCLGLALVLAACGGGGGGGSSGPLLSDAARRAVLADIGEEIILPALREFDALAQALAAAVAAHAADPAAGAVKADAQDAWRAAVSNWQRSEVLQVGPAARSTQPGGEDRRDLIYAYPERTLCLIDAAAYNGDAVTAGTRIDVMGLGSLEYLLFFDGDNPSCPPASGVDRPQARADYASKVAAFIASQASALRNRWEPGQGNFLAQWSNAGLGGSVYGSPQAALNALTAALFYVEKETKDRKIACPTGIGATGLSCAGANVNRVEFPIARESTPALNANVIAFAAVFSGVNGGMGINDLLEGVGRQDIAARLDAHLAAVLAHLNIEIAPDFESEVEAINDSTACLNASSARSGEPAACALHGQLKAAMDTFRTEVVAALSLTTPGNAAGDND